MSKELLIIPIVGELTLATVEQVEAPLVVRAKSGRNLVLDMSRLTVMTTPGIGMLLEVNRAAAEAGGRLFVARMNSHITDLIERTQLHRVLSVVPTIDAAADLLQQNP